MIHIINRLKMTKRGLVAKETKQEVSKNTMPTTLLKNVKSKLMKR